MPFLIRPSRHSDFDYLHELSTSLSANGFLTLPSDEKELKELIELSEKSFVDRPASLERAKYLFSLEDLKSRRVVGCSLIIGRHGTETSPHLFFQINEEKQTITFMAEETGRTELGGLILDPAYRGRKAKLGKALSLIRFVYVKRNPARFCENLVAELLPRFSPEGKSPFWETLGRRWTSMSYREADLKSRRDKRFFMNMFPRGPIAITSLSSEAQSAMGQVGPETEPVVKILTSIGFHYLHEIDPFDGGPHYGAKQSELKFDVVDRFFEEQEEEREIR
jgi:arginine N-succinyltransferase